MVEFLSAEVFEIVGLIVLLSISTFTRKELRKVHLEVNSRLSELLKSREREAGEAGEARGRDQRNQDDDDRPRGEGTA